MIQYKVKDYGAFKIGSATFPDYRVERYIDSKFDNVFDGGWTRNEATAVKRELEISYHLDF